MALQFHPLVFGLMLVVTAGTVAYTLWSSPQNYCVGYDTNMRKRRRRGDECCICLDNLENNIKTLNCHHMFHSNCISMWLNSNHTCPICRELTFGN